MKTVRLLIIALVLTVGSVAAANAQTRFHVSVNSPGVRVSAGNYRPYYNRGYYAPVYRRGYYAPAYRRGYYRPAYYRSYRRPVVVHRTYYRNAYHRGGYYHRGRW